MHILERNGEDKPLHQKTQPARPFASGRLRAQPQDVVAFVNRLQKRFQMVYGPRLTCRRDQHDR
jgi:hypothetical protein